MSQKKLQLHMAWKEKRRQQQLKAQYGIDRPDVVVVERKNVFVITLRVILHAAYIALRICASCAVAVLAIIGLASLIYPNIRAELVNSLGQVSRPSKSRGITPCTASNNSGDGLLWFG